MDGAFALVPSVLVSKARVFERGLPGVWDERVQCLNQIKVGNRQPTQSSDIPVTH